MDAAALEEANRLRAELGMKPLPVPGAATSVSSDADSDEDAPSTLESREAKAYDNYKQVQEAEAAKKKREEKAAAVKKARDAAQRFAVLEGKGLGDADGGDMDAKSWVKNYKKRQRKIEKARKLEEELAAAEAQAAAAVQYTSKDLAGIKVAHDMDSFLDGDEQILTLKDATIGEYEEEGDELENLGMREREKLEETLTLKKKKPDYNPLDVDETGERGILSKYDEEIHGKKLKKFTLDGDGAFAEIADILDQPAKNRGLQTVNLDSGANYTPSSDYLDISEIKVKKPKKKKSKSTRQKPVDEDDIFPREATPEDGDKMELDLSEPSRKRKTHDTTDFVDDEDLHTALSIQRRDALKKRKKMRPEDIARQLKEEAEDLDSAMDSNQAGGLVIGQASEFVSGITKLDAEEGKPKKPKATAKAAVTVTDPNSKHEDQVMKDAEEEPQPAEKEVSSTVDVDVIEEKTVGESMGAALSLLRERGFVKPEGGEELHERYLHKQAFLSKTAKIAAEQEEYVKQQRERDRASGKLDRMSVRDREEYLRSQNTHRDLQQSRRLAEMFDKEFKPSFEIKYTDEHGRTLNRREAWKQLSYSFHGRGSGPAAVDRRLKRIEQEKQREAQSMLDASQNVGISSVTAQQLKKRKEAGVRLG